MISKRTVINNYSELFDYVKRMKDLYNLASDTEELTDDLIYRWFSQKGVRGLDSCYQEFNQKLQNNKGITIKMDEGTIKAEWEES